MDVKKQILVQLGRYALQSMTHRHVFATDDLRSYATTKAIGPVHSHRIYVDGKWIDTTSNRSGEQHRHKAILNGREIISGLPVEGPSTDFF